MTIVASPCLHHGSFTTGPCACPNSCVCKGIFGACRQNYYYGSPSYTFTFASSTMAMNKKVAVEPISTTVEKEVRHAVAVAKQKMALIPTKVVFPDSDGKVLAGYTVYLRGDIITHPCAKEVFELDGKKFILVSLEQIQLVKTTETKWNTLTAGGTAPVVSVYTQSDAEPESK